MEKNNLEQLGLDGVPSEKVEVPMSKVNEAGGGKASEHSEKRFYTVRELAKIMGISEAYTYQYIKSEACKFTVLQIGKRYTIPVKSFEDWYNTL